ncbi:hypothetical protein [Caldalkalibacillus mannanilyticus]|uniref:hypothetical protein n=1 Tax=Caldalkalibacillus mannanilyticus TaxID=1418 RepID=UPI00046989A6|nr:hypothetical protein [Caldalkalibacillus mannanilyticus]
MKNVRRDPILLMIIAGTLLLALVFRFTPPALSEWLFEHYAFDLVPYYDLMLLFILQLTPLMIGMVSGFLILDERDEHIIPLLAVTPLQKKGYLMVRLVFPMCLTAVMSLFLIFYTELSPITGSTIPLLLILLALEAPMFGLFLVAFASNKVEGLALAKVSGILTMTPLAVYFISWPWQGIFTVLPTYWMAQLFELQESLIQTLGIFMVGLFLHMGILWYLYSRFNQKIE